MAPQIDWPAAIFDVLREKGVTQVCHVPDAGHDRLIKLCNGHNDMSVTTLTTEEEGVGLLAGAWLGGQRGVLLMQSSGVGNTINALALPAACRMPLLTIVSMRGEWGEGNPWQVPAGRGAPKALEAMGVALYRADSAEEVGATVDAAARIAFNTNSQTAVLLSQRLIGAKSF
ncbi:MAG: thiamine pyrophosphate-binding protein [Proteobacteria bacterium]|nr:thiamine pyrophosphate-binding protein [Pseudomonadota bacterium]